MQQWSGVHVVVLLLTAAVSALLVAVARRQSATAATAILRRTLALLILAAYVAEHLTYAVRGLWSPEVNLPLHLTDAVTLLSIAALWRPEHPLVVELVYFWALSASLQAVMTPDLGHAFPDPLFLTYFVTHSGAIIAACLLVFGERRAPRRGAVPRAYAVTAAFAVVAALGSVASGGNYMYLRRKPVNDSLLDLMGPWPVYVLVGAVLALALFVLLAVLASRAAARPPLQS
jgi:hypothetical integral membrane protein (TIGR02206 family)